MDRWCQVVHSWKQDKSRCPWQDSNWQHDSTRIRLLGQKDNPACRRDMTCSRPVSSNDSAVQEKHIW